MLNLQLHEWSWSNWQNKSCSDTVKGKEAGASYAKTIKVAFKLGWFVGPPKKCIIQKNIGLI